MIYGQNDNEIIEEQAKQEEFDESSKLSKAERKTARGGR